MICDLGLEDRLVGVTFECPSDKPRIVRSRLEGKKLSSQEIDRIVGESAARGETLYYVDLAALQEAAPDVIFTQHVCDVCQIGTAYVERAVHHLPKVPKLVPLVPRRLDDVFDNVLTIARELDAEAVGRELCDSVRARLARVKSQLAVANAPTRRVMVMEWLDPIYNCGHWIPDQIELAGGHDEQGRPGGYSVAIDWEEVRRYDPEVLVVAPCGFHVPRALEEIATLARRPGFGELRCARDGKVFVADAELFTQPSLAQLAQGVELLAHLFHPQAVSLQEGLNTRFAPLSGL
jgi:iron complex transport system substrate-binding protein